MEEPMWTTERPTKAGEYWLSIAPSQRGSWPAVFLARIMEGCRWYVDGEWEAADANDKVLFVGGSSDYHYEEQAPPWDKRLFLDDKLLRGAQWREQIDPADPFEPADPAEKFFILDTRQIVGNCAMFWRPDGAGYTCDINEAGLYDKTRSDRDTDIYVPVKEARAMAVTHVRVEPLKRAGYWSKPPERPKGPQRCASCPRFVRRDGWLCKRCLQHKAAQYAYPPDGK